MLVPFRLKSKLFYSWTMQWFLYACMCSFTCGYYFLLEHIPQKRNICKVHNHDAAPVELLDGGIYVSSTTRHNRERLEPHELPGGPYNHERTRGPPYLISQITGKFYLLLKFKWNQSSYVSCFLFSTFCLWRFFNMSVKL